VKPVYYGMAEDIVKIINRHTGVAVKKSGKTKMLYQFIRQKVEMMMS
jgi:hypothetical protein